jgi:WD40 repeat protein
MEDSMPVQEGFVVCLGLMAVILGLTPFKLSAGAPPQTTASEKNQPVALPVTKEELLGELSAQTDVPGPAIAERGWKEFLIDPYAVEHGTDYFVDSASLRFAVPAKQGKRWVLVVDGNEKKLFDGIESVLVSPGGQHVVFSAKRDEKWVKMLDDKELGPAFDELGGGFWFWGAAELGRYAYAAKRGKKWLIVADSKEGLEYEEVGRPVFNSDGHHLAYRAKNTKNGEVIVVDGKEQAEFREVGAPHFSPDGQHLAYWAKIAKKHETIVLDGKEGPQFEKVSRPHFSPDGKRIAYIASRGKRKIKQRDSEFYFVPQVVVLDGNEGPEFEEVSNPVFSPDGQHLAYQGKRPTYEGHKDVLILDGTEKAEFQYAGGLPVLSPDSQHIAYVGWEKGSFVGFLDGKRLDGAKSPGAWRNVEFSEEINFSPDSKRLAYVVGWGGQAYLEGRTTRAHRCVVVDGHVGEDYDTLGIDMGFSPDSRHFVYSVRGGVSGDKSTVVIDGQTGKLYDDVIGGAFRDATDNGGSSQHAFIYIAREGRKFYRVTQPLSSS